VHQEPDVRQSHVEAAAGGGQDHRVLSAGLQRIQQSELEVGLILAGWALEKGGAAPR